MAFVCNTCFAVFNNQLELDNHKNHNHYVASDKDQNKNENEEKHNDDFDLARLFAETDEEMWMMIEDIQKCQKCGLCFLTEENLRCHEDRCCNKEMKYRCVYCNRKFDRELYKNLHQHNCDRNQAGPSHHRMKQTKIDDYTPNNRTAQAGGSNQPTDETWAPPKKLQSAVNNKAVTYRKEFDGGNKENLFERLQIVLHMFKNTIKSELEKRPGIKYYYTLRMIFHQSKNTSILSDPPVSFRSEVFAALDFRKLDLHLQVALNQFEHQIEEFQRNGSGWAIDHFVNVDIGK